MLILNKSIFVFIDLFFFDFFFYLKKGLYMLKYKNTDRYLISIKIIFWFLNFNWRYYEKDW